MAIPLKSQADVLNNILNEIKVDTDNGIAFYENSTMRDIFIDPMANQVYETDIKADFVNRSSNFTELRRIVLDNVYKDRLRYVLNITFSQVVTLISQVIDNLASNFNEVRLQPTYSIGYVRMFFDSGTAFTLPGTITFATPDGTQFITTNTFSSFTPQYDTTTGQYYIDTAVRCTVAGTIGNVEIGSISKVVGTVTGLVSAYNITRMSFGTDLESDIDFIDRIRNSMASRNVSVLQGITDIVSTYPGVYDVAVVTPNDVEANRLEKNAVDIYLLAEERPQIVEDIFNIFTARYAWDRIGDELNFEVIPVVTTGDVYFKMLNQPVTTINNVLYGSVNTSFPTSLSYTLVKDTTGVYADSRKGNDYISIVESSLPAQTGYIKINYTYDALYEALQSLIRNYRYYIIGADILFKKAQEVLLDINVVINVLEGYVEADVKTNINTNLRIFFEGGTDLNGNIKSMIRLGEKVDLSDIQNIILDTEGVDSIDLDSFTVSINGNSITGISYTPTFKEYLRFGTITYNTKQSIENPNIIPVRNITINPNLSQEQNTNI